MKLAYRAFLLTLTITALMISVSAQTLRPEKDPRNIAPTVGTGGPPGGPTGLFTVFDGQTLRKGEFTVSVAYSNFDRDPGDVDIVEVPISFQVGLNDYMEVFFNTDAFRQVKVNSPGNLSSLHLPNAALFGGPAVVLSPNRLFNGNPRFIGQAVYRPIGNQPFVPYPYTGGLAGNFGYPPGAAGFPSLGPPINTGTNGASNFPGIGSTYGSILPGVVFSTVVVNGADLPTVFTVAPIYLPDAPLMGARFGESAFNTFTFGAKIRFTNPSNPIGVGIIPFYRFYADNANSIGGFNELQSGSSPGGNKGDVGLIGFADARLRKWVNVSANIGYVYNSSITNGAPTLLDRGDEVLAAFAVDFPVNKFFQPIVEVRSQQFVGGRTPNAFENNPIDLLAGVRIFPKRWMSIGGAYRYHANQQDQNSLNGVNFTNTVVVGCLLNPPGPNCAPRIIQTQSSGIPLGFTPSSEPHGFIVQTTIGRRNPRLDVVPNKPATINSVDLSAMSVKKPCEPGFRPKEGETCDDNQTINVRTSASDPEGDVLTYNYTVSGGRIEGQGANVTWDLSGVSPGQYTLTTAIDDGCGVCSDPVTKTVTVEACDCEKQCDCGELSVSGPPAVVQPGETMTFRAEVVGGDQQNLNYNWSVDKGEIVSGQGTPNVVVGGTDSLAGETVTATVEVTADCAECTRTDSDTGIVATEPEPTLIDEFGALANNDLKARIDNLNIALQSDPSAVGYIINYGPAKAVAAREKVIREQIKFRNLDPNKFVLVKGGVEPTIRTRVWVVPAGADQSTVN